MAELRDNLTTNDEDEEGQLVLKHQSISSGGNDSTILDYKYGFSIHSLLPEEVLELIFQKVESPKDVLSCWNTTPAWAAALRTTKNYFKMTLPFVLPYLNSKDLLRCSAVSKSWNATVDVCIQEAESFGSASRLRKDQQIKMMLEWDNNISGFIDKFILSTNNESGVKRVATNPVAFRCVEFFFGDFDGIAANEKLSIYQNEIIKCLSHHGHLIRNLRLVFLETGTVSNLEKIKLIRSCVKLTPNLRVLDITFETIQGIHGNVQDLLRVEGDEELAAVQELEAFNTYISDNPWPSLEHLKVLRFYDFTNQEQFASFANAYAPQLVYLQFGFKLVEQNMPLNGRFACLQKIKYLLDESESATQFAAFVRSNECPLKTLIIEMPPTDSEYMDEENMNGLISAVNVASATLETLDFRRCGAENGIFDVVRLEELRLPKLKVLELDPFSCPSIQFLQSVCPALQQLFIRSSVASNSDSDDIADTRRMYLDLYSQHQFWNQMPYIQTVDVALTLDGFTIAERKHYTRRGYDAYVGQVSPANI